MDMSTILLERSIPEPMSGCWLWLRARIPEGYGHIAVDGKNLGAHRVSYETFVGPIPDGLWVLHRCDTPPCINPRHLFLGTHKQNVADSAAKGRHHHGRKLDCPAGHPYSGSNLYVRPSGQRNCKICRNESIKRPRTR